MKKNITFTLFFFLLLCATLSAQDLRVIDNKGTLQNINKVTQGTSLPTNPVRGDINYDSFTNPTVIQIFDGTTWRLLNKNQLVNYIDNTTTPKHKIGEIDSDNNPATTNVDVFETVTLAEDKNTSTDVKTIATYKNENGVAQNIEETVTKIDNLNPSPDANKKLIGRYHKEDATTVDIKETVTRIEQVSTGQATPVLQDQGRDDNKSVDRYGDIKYYNEVDPTANPTRVRVVSAYPDNAIKVGPDGGAYMLQPMIKASGKVGSGGNCLRCFNSSVNRDEQGLYTVTITDTSDVNANYVIQLSKADNTDSRRPYVLSSYNFNISYKNVTSNTFQVEITNTANTKYDVDFMFTVISW